MVNHFYTNSDLETIGDNIVKPGDSMFVAHSVSSDVTDMTTNPGTYFKVYEYKNGSLRQWGRATTPLGSYHIHGSGYHRYKYSRGSDKPILGNANRNYHYGSSIDMLATTWSSGGNETAGSQIFTSYYPSYASSYDTEIQQVWDDVADGNTPTPLPYLSTKPVRSVDTRPHYFEQLNSSRISYIPKRKRKRASQII